MAQPIFTFSIPEQQPKDLAFVKKIKEDCKRSGQSFSFVVLEALKKHNGKSNG